MKNISTILFAFLLVLMVPLSFNQAKASPLGGPLGATITGSSGVLCFGVGSGTATVAGSGGTSPYTYLWSTTPTQTTATATGLTAGSYTVVVTDAASATATASVAITQPPPLFVTMNMPTYPTCNGGTGCASGSVGGGTLPYSYHWTPTGGFSNPSCTLTAGIYTLTVTDNNACTASANVTITQPSSVFASASIVSNISCNGASNGSVMASEVGGIGTITYLWSDANSQTTATATGLSAGTYSVTVTATNGCGVASVTLTQPNTVTANITAFSDIVCYASYSGSATVGESGGIAPLTYLWDDASSQTTATANALSAGTYSVTVTATNGCAVASVTLTQPTQITLTVTGVGNISCNGGNDGTASAIGGGGVPAYSYYWSTSPVQTNSTATGLSVGCYTVEVLDVNNCSATAIACVSQPTILTATITGVTNILCNGVSDGSLTPTVTGGTSPYTYLWMPGGEINSTATGLSAGCYTLTVTDYNGCTVTASACLTQPAALILTRSFTGDTGLCSGTATVSVSGGQYPYTYFWSNSVTTAEASNLCAGVYCCTVTDNAGCMDSVCMTVTSCSNNYVEPICIITLDTVSNKCELIWGRTNSPPSGGYGNYNVYRDSSGFTLTHTQPLNVLSEYIDPNSNPSAGPVSYKLSTVDSCGESALSPVHTSIYLTTTSGFNVYILNWTAYVGFTPLEYIIFRGPSLSMLVPIDTIPNTIFTFHDTLPPPGSYYVLEAVSPFGPCIPTSHRANLHSISLLSGSFSNGFNTATLGINNLKEIANLNVYPNPSNGMFTVSYSMTVGDNVRISIINELGQEVYREQKHINSGTNTEQLNIENLASGIYSLRIQTSNDISVRKLNIIRNK